MLNIKDIARWHTSIVQEVIKNKRLVMPTGREYTYEMKLNYAGVSMPPETTIKNYPVQGLGADIMAVIRVEFWKVFHKANINGVLVNTIHDSIVCDVEDSEVQRL